MRPWRQKALLLSDLPVLDYPLCRMSPTFRRLLFLLFAFVFLISAPVLVLYTAGYRFSGSFGRIVPTGLISIQTVPTTAHVRVDDDLQTGQTPLLVKDLLPGSHRVELIKEGYLPWTKNLTVESRATTFIINAVICADVAPLLVRETKRGSDTFDASGNRVAFVREGHPWFEIWFYDTRSGEDHMIARLPSSAGPVSTLRWSPDGSALEIVTNPRGQETAVLVETETGRQIDVENTVRGAERGWWDAGAGAKYLVTIKTGLYQITLDGIAKRLGERVDAAMTVEEERLIAQNVKDQVAISRWSPLNISTPVAYLPLGSYAFEPAPNNLILLSDQSRGRITVLDVGAADHPILLNTEAIRWVWEPNGRRLLYSDGNDLRVYDPATRIDDTITRLSDPITDLAWHPANSAAAFTQDGHVSLIEFDGRDGHITTILAEGTGFGSVRTDVRGRSIFFFGTIGGKTGLWQRLLQK